MAVTFNHIPANIRVPLFYAEVNAGESPYQGPSRLLLVGQITSGATMAANTIAVFNGDAQALAGRGSQLSEMALWARQNHPFGEIWLAAVGDPAGVAAVQSIMVAAGIVGKSGTAVIYVGGERVQVAVAPTDTQANVATNIAAAINAGFVKFQRSLLFPVVAAVDGLDPNKVNLTARNVGALGNAIAVDFNLVGDEGALQQYLSVASGTAGTGIPALGALLTALGDAEFDWIASPYSDATSLNTLRDFLDGIAGRWSPYQQLFGHHVSVLFDTYSNQAALGSTRNDPNASIMGAVNSPSPPWRWAAALAAQIAKDKNLGGEVDQAYRISLPLQTLKLVGVMPPKARVNWPSIQERNTLYQDGISSFRVDPDGQVAIDRVITSYRQNAYGNPDITWLSVETRAQMVYFVRYTRQRITQVYGRSALASDGAEGRPGIVTPKMLKAECVHIYKELEAGGLVEKSGLFASSLIVERASDPNRVNAYLPIDVVNQLNVFAANVTTLLEYPAAA